MHLKGIRFGFPIVRRLGLLKHNETRRVAWNRHTGLEIHYVFKGDIVWEIQRHVHPLAVSGGSFGIIPANVRHRALNSNGTPSFRLGMILERPTPQMVEGTPFTADDLKRIFRRFKENGGHALRFSRRLSAILHDLIAAATIENATDPDGQLRLRTLTASLIEETYMTMGEPEAIAEGHDVAPKIRKWIEEHYAEKITVSKLVKLSGYGRSRFFSLFLSDTGTSPNDYIVRVRISRAKQLLSRKRMTESMLDLAVACGFASASVFSTTFRKHVGVSPRDFRRAAFAG